EGRARLRSLELDASEGRNNSQSWLSTSWFQVLSADAPAAIRALHFRCQSQRLQRCMYRCIGASCLSLPFQQATITPRSKEAQCLRPGSWPLSLSLSLSLSPTDD
ncbi:unnamed protein product, partial [Ectocarpus sp. 8 AP-2014]